MGVGIDRAIWPVGKVNPKWGGFVGVEVGGVVDFFQTFYCWAPAGSFVFPKDFQVLVIFPSRERDGGGLRGKTFRANVGP